MKQKIILGVILVLVVVSIFYFESRKVDTSGEGGGTEVMAPEHMSAEEKAKQYELAKEISSPDAFINVEPNPTDGQVSITIEGELAKGNIVLVDFWTYSCINCQRTLPYLNDWYKKYKDQGLTIIGIHTPEFEFEKDIKNVQRAVDQFRVTYPVVLDNDFSTWRSYKNRYWPRKYLVDIDGFIVYDHIGEGGYDKTEAKIVELLNERKVRLGEEDMLELVDDGAPEGVDVVDFEKVGSREAYFGSSRLEFLVNLPSEGCVQTECTYVAPAEVQPGAFALSGSWRIEEERAVLTEGSGSIIIHFLASKVNLVAEGLSGAVSAEILLDGVPIGEQGGVDVENSVVTFSEAALYNLVDLEGDYSQHVLEIRMEEGTDLAAFAFTFG